MKLIIISGLSGSGKTIALHTLEDEDFYCVDNLPPDLLPAFVHEIYDKDVKHYEKAAVGIDARTSSNNLKNFAKNLEELRNIGVDVEVIFIHSDDSVLIKRFSETRRKHPLSHDGLPLIEAIQLERKMLSTIQEIADLVIDSSRKNIYDLRNVVSSHVGKKTADDSMSLLFQSFGFKHGVPGDTDLVFDVRCLPNPHWDPKLRPLTGQDAEIKQFLQEQPQTGAMLDSIKQFLETWLPDYQAQNRRYMTVSIGCTGGQHRSVYLCEALGELFSSHTKNISVRHRELP